MRPRFEPTDLELEKPGVLDIDLQVGYVAATPTSRVVLPDFELDLGITRRFELDLDGAYAFDPTGDSLPDNLWLSGKVGVFDFAWPNRLQLAGGVQLGPRFPTARGASSVGVDALVLLGLSLKRTQLVLNAGGYVDPLQATPGAATARPIGIQLGLSIDVDLTATGDLSFHGEISSVIAIKVDPNQVVLAGGVTWSPTKFLDLSVLVLAGLLPGADRAGALAGFSPKLRLWR